jgi:hypothetical protein
VHVGQFLAMAIVIGGLIGLVLAVEAQLGAASWAGRLGAASAVAALALYGALQAVDGVANKQADVAWLSAPDAEKAARFASAEAVRWVEWGLRSYHDFTLGLAVLLLAAAVARTAGIPRPIAYLMGLSGLACLVQGWGGRLRRLLRNAQHPDCDDLGSERRLDDLAGRGRLADAGVAAPSRGPMTPGAAPTPSSYPATLSTAGNSAAGRWGSLSEAKRLLIPIRSPPPVGEVLRAGESSGLFREPGRG